MYLLLMESYGGLAVRISNLTEAVKKQAAGDASQEEYILREFGSSAVELAVTVVMMAVFAYIDGRPLKGGVEEGKGGTGSGGGKEPRSDGNGSGEGGSGESGSDIGDSGGSGTDSGGEGKGETGADGSESGSNTGTVWDNITPTQENYPSTNIPKSFEVEVNGQKIWVHGNATKHIYQEVSKRIAEGNGTAYTNPNLYTQELMSDFYGSLQKATKSGIIYEQKITQGSWEFVFVQPKQAGLLPVIKHAQFNGWH